MCCNAARTASSSDLLCRSGPPRCSYRVSSGNEFNTVKAEQLHVPPPAGMGWPGLSSCGEEQGRSQPPAARPLLSSSRLCWRNKPEYIHSLTASVSFTRSALHAPKPPPQIPLRSTAGNQNPEMLLQHLAQVPGKSRARVVKLQSLTRGHTTAPACSLPCSC